MENIPGEVSQQGTLNLHRDLVFIEQRSTGQSNPLSYPAFPGLPDKAALRASVQSCLAHLHGDLRFYTTAMYADDISQLLGDLHYATANFVGISYGTTAEQIFLLRHPGQVRTLTLISGIPLNIALFERRPWRTPSGGSTTSARVTAARSRPSGRVRRHGTAGWPAETAECCWRDSSTTRSPAPGPWPPDAMPRRLQYRSSDRRA